MAIARPLRVLARCYFGAAISADGHGPAMALARRVLTSMLT